MHQDSTGLDSELEWMLQSSQVDDALLIEALIHKYYSGLYQLTLSVTGNPQTAAQTAGQAITSAVAKRHRYSGEYSLRVWLYALGFRATRKSAQKSKPAPFAGDKHDGEKLAVSGLSKSLLDLDHKHRLPAILRYGHGLNLRETGHVLGLRERAVHARLNFIRRAGLAEIFPGSEKDPLHPEMGDFMRESLDGLLEGKNSFEYQARLEMHLDECRECTAYSNLLTKVEGQIRASAPQLWPVPDLPENELKAAQAEMLLGAGRNRRRQSLSLSMKSFSLAAVMIVMLAWIGFSTDIFASVPPEQAAQVNSRGGWPTQPAEADTGAGLTRTRPRPTGIGPSVRQDGYPLISGEYLPPRINLRLAPQGAVLPQIIERLAWNNSGPLSLFNVLEYWGWQGELEEILAELQPDLEKQHVPPDEIVDFIDRQTGLSSLWRFGGDLETLKLLAVGGYPTIIAKGAEAPNVSGWFAHYAIVHGYNDIEGFVRLADLRLPDTQMQDLAYEDFIREWRAMNYTFLVIYPPQQEGRLFDLLGQYADENYALRMASRLGSNETRNLTGRDKFFAAFNHGTSHAYLGEFDRAAHAFNEAMTIYSGIPEENRPWRILWYEPSPYHVYHQMEPSGVISQAPDEILADTGWMASLNEEDCQAVPEVVLSGRGGAGDIQRIYSQENAANLMRLIACAQQ
jgi:DNA-directed RNA polymerase specialized sigma24 family protein